MSSQTILYDLPARDGKAWSPNPWKTRMLLNFKGIPYTTQWVEYPDIAPLGQKLGLAPNAESPAYSIPMVQFESKHYMDSVTIAAAIETAVPTPGLRIADPMVARVRAALGRCFTPLREILIPRVPAELLNAASQPYFVETRTKFWGRPLADVEAEARTAAGQDKAFAEAAPGIEELLALLRENAAGPFFLGDKASYADFYLVAGMHFFKRVDAKYFERFVGYGKELDELYRACEPWLKKDD